MSERHPFETAFRPSYGPRILLVVVVLAVAGVIYWRWREAREAVPLAPAEQPKPATPATTAAPSLPPAEGDSLARQLAKELSTASELAKWLAEPDILRRLVAAVNMVAEGNSPRPLLSFLVPSGQFEIARAGRSLHPSPKSYARYETVTRVLTSIDPAAAGKAYGRMKSYVDSAFAQIGRPGQSFDAVLHQAIAGLVSTPVPEADPELEEKGLVYVYRDQKLEQLNGAQKQLLRMGPENARAIQAWLKKLDETIPK